MSTKPDFLKNTDNKQNLSSNQTTDVKSVSDSVIKDQIYFDIKDQLFHLSSLYLTGEFGFAKNESEGLKLLEELVNKKYEKAYLILARYYYEGCCDRIKGDESPTQYEHRRLLKAIEVLRKGIDEIKDKDMLNACKTQYAEYILFHSPNLFWIPQKIQAKNFLIDAANGNIGFAQYRLGCLLKSHKVQNERRQLIELDEKRALEYFEMAFNSSSDQAKVFSALEAGRAFAQGLGTEVNLKRARVYIEYAAKAGDTDAQLIYADFLRNGKGGAQDLKQAEKFYLLAALNGQEAHKGTAYYFLGMMALEKKDSDEAFLYFEKSSKFNFPSGKLQLAALYLKRKGYNKRKIKTTKANLRALTLLKEILASNANQDDKNETLFLLGQCYLEGLGVEKDEKTAIKYISEAAEFQHLKSLEFLYNHYRFGTPKYNLNELLKWLEKATVLGDRNASILFAGFVMNGIGLPKDTKRAFELIKQAYDSGEPSAPNALGICYLNGIGIQEEPAKAVELFNEASQKDSVFALNNLANCYLFGTGIKKNEKKGYKLLEDVRKKVSFNVSWQSTWCVFNGIGIAKNINAAIANFISGNRNRKQSKQENLFTKPNIFAYYYSYNIGFPISIDVILHKNPKFIASMAICHLMGWGFSLEPDLKEALKLMLIAPAETIEILLDKDLTEEYRHILIEGFRPLMKCGEKPIEDAVYKAFVELNDKQTLERYYQNLYIDFKDLLDKQKIIDVKDAALLEQRKKDFISKFQELIQSLIRTEKFTQAKELLWNYAKIFMDGIKCEQDPKLVFEFLIQGSELPQAASPEIDFLTPLGYCYLTGTGCKRSIKRGIKFLKEANLNGRIDAKINLAWWFLHEHSDLKKHQDIDPIKLIHEAIGQGSKTANMILAWCYLNGMGVQKDIKKATELFNDQEIEYRDGGFYSVHSFGMKIFDKTIMVFCKEYSKQALLNYSKGLCYFNGWCFPRDLEKAYQLFEQAQDENNNDAVFQIAFCLRKGLGVKKDVARAKQIYKGIYEITNKKDTPKYKAYKYRSLIEYAILNLELGKIAGRKRLKRSVEILSHTACKHNFPLAKAYLAELYLYGCLVQQNVNKAMKLFKEAADAGIDQSQCNLGILYYNGEYNIPRNLKYAFEFYSLAAKSGNSDAEVNLASMYEDGEGTDQNIDLAIKYYMRASAKNHPRGLRNLARCYENGIGVIKNFKISHRLYSKALELRLVDCAQDLLRLNDNKELLQVSAADNMKLLQTRITDNNKEMLQASPTTHEFPVKPMQDQLLAEAQNLKINKKKRVRI